MKRSLFIAIVVLLMAALFVSCNAEKSMEDQLFEVSIDEGARALQATGEFDIDINQYYWFYTATKTSGGFRTGEKTAETPVKTANDAPAAGIIGASLGSFSKGTWEFSFFGYADPADKGEEAKRVYFQTGLSQTVSSAVSLAITLVKGEGALPPATVEFDNPSWYHADFAILPSNQTTGGYDLTLKVFVGDATEAWKTVTATTEDGRARFAIADTLTLASANTLRFRVYWGEDLVGSEDLVIAAEGSTKYTVKDLNNLSGITPVLSEEYGVVVFDASVPGLEATEAKGTISVSVQDPTVVKASVAPTASTQTTVTFPAGSFETAGTHELTIAVDDAAAAAETTFVVQDTSVDVSGAPIAVLSFTLTDAPATFGEYVEVETYIQTGLDPASIKVIYNGADGKEQPKDVTYTANDGKLTFKTKHFSDYVVVSTAAVARIGNALYESFAAAFAAVEDGETITLLKDTTGAINLETGDTITIDVNGTTFNGGYMWITDDSTLIVDGSKAGSKVLGSFYIGYATNNNGNLVLNGGEYVCSAGATAIHINGTCLDSDVTIQNASITSPDDNGIQLNGSGTFLIENSTITGATAIYIKSGVLTINGGNYTGNMNPVNYTYNGNGANATGDAIVIDSCEYPGGAPTVTINAGTFTGTKNAIGYYQYDGSKPSDGILEDAIINVNGGTFNGLANPVALVRNGAAFATLMDAIDSVADDTPATIVLLRDVTDGTGLATDSTDADSHKKNLTIDFNGKTYTMKDPAVGSTGTKTQAMHWAAGSTIVLKNGTFAVQADAVNVKMGMQNYANLKIENMQIDLRSVQKTFYEEDVYQAYPDYYMKEVPIFNVSNLNASLLLKDSTVLVADAISWAVLADGPLTIDNCNLKKVAIGDGTVTVSNGEYVIVSYFDNKEVAQNGNVYSLVDATN